MVEIVQLKSQLNKYRILKRDTILQSVKDKNRLPLLKVDARFPVELYRPMYDIANPYTDFIGDYIIPEDVIKDRVMLPEGVTKDQEKYKRRNSNLETSPFNETDRFISDAENSNIMP